MKLYQYLNEAKAQEIEYEDAEKEYHKVYKQCKKYFGLIKTKKPLYRTVNQKMFGSDIYFKKKVRQDRKSRSALTRGSEFEKFLNNKLEEMGHNNRTKSVSTTPNYNHALMFSKTGKEVYYFLPIGNFSYSWCPSKDWNFGNPNWDTRIFTKMRLELEGQTTDMGYDWVLERFEDMLSSVKTDKGFDIAYKEGFEIWFNCKEYYLIDPNSELGEMVE